MRSLTVRVEDEVFVAAAERAAREDRPLSWVVRSALERFLDERPSAGPVKRREPLVREPVVVPGDGPRKVVPDIPGVTKGLCRHSWRQTSFGTQVCADCGVLKP